MTTQPRRSRAIHVDEDHEQWDGIGRLRLSFTPAERDVRVPPG